MRRPLPSLDFRRLALCASVFVMIVVATSVRGDDRGIPAPFAPLEYLVGSWKGQGVTPKDRIRGWTETHAWAWDFVEGAPIGLTFQFQGSKQIKGGALTYDEGRRLYVLKVEPLEGEGEDDGEPIVYEGTLDGAGKLLTLNRIKTPTGAPAERVTLRANSNSIRYTLSFERRSARSGPFSKTAEVGLTKEGETFAAGGSGGERAKCVVTGGAAAQTVSYQGKSFPICCSGCRDEFLESPEKYIQKASGSSPSSDAEAPKPSRRNDDF